ncbi:uncharacterized protein V6R79_025090 [Siganus canaliculatus]
MESAALVAPVTALEFLQDTFLLTGEGPVLTVYSLHPHPKACASVSLLQHCRIHGIRPRGWRSASQLDSATGTFEGEKDEPCFYDLAVFGGKAVRLVRLHVTPRDEEDLRWEILSPLMELQDWALDVRWLLGDKHSLLCVAVAHNSALLLDATTGHVLLQRSCMEGCLLYSALLLTHETWEDTVIVGGTVFNQLVLWKPGGGNTSTDTVHKAPVERRLLGHSGVIFNITYLQEKGCLASASDDRSVRVWGVGALGGPGGTCGDLSPVCLMVLYGHQARVFSVRLSPGKVFSAGEDGACLVWDWAGGGKVIRTLKGHRAGGVRALAVSEGTGEEERWVATGGADGGVRLWRVKGSEERKEEVVSEKLNDLKFPGEGLPKVVCPAGEGDENTGWNQSKFVVCTDLGTVHQYSDGQWEMLWQGSAEFQSYCVMETTTGCIRGSTEKVTLCAVGNLSGCIQVFPISHPQCGILLTGGSSKIHSVIWLNGKKSMHLLASGADGLVYRWSIDAEHNDLTSIILSANPLPSFLLPPCAKRWLTAAVSLRSGSHGSLWVCGDRRGSLLLFQEGEKLKHTMEESERKDENDPALHPLSCLFGVHGKQGVTSVCEYQGLLYSAGRDGCVRVFRVRPTTPEGESQGQGVENKGGLQLEILRVQRACKGMEWLERVLILEPETSVAEKEEENLGNYSKTSKENLSEKLEVTEDGKSENKAKEARFVIVGFHAVHFVVWDPVRQERLLAVPCGGGHRSWSLWPSCRGVWPGYGALVFIKQGAVLASQPPGKVPGRAGGWGLREGVHGRGIGCVCRLGRMRGTRNEIRTAMNSSPRNVSGTEEKDGLEDGGKTGEGEGGYWEIVVTGGEDTSLTVLALQPDSGSVRVLSVITDHISSVRTLTAVTCPERSGDNQTLSALLLSAGGRAQMQCYRLLIGWDTQRLLPSCQVIQVASHRLDEQWERRRNRHKLVKMDPETRQVSGCDPGSSRKSQRWRLKHFCLCLFRYMSVVTVDENTDVCRVAVACSDGALRLFTVSEDKHQIELLWETFHHQRCVLSVASCSLEDGKGNRYGLLFSAATDGKIAVWDVTEASSLSAASSSSTPTPPIPCLDIPAHQSGVNSLAVCADKWGQQEGGCLVTVASGGDDGQLTVSTIKVQFPEDGKARGSREFSQIPSSTDSHPSDQLHVHLLSQSHVPLAHAAPLTSLKLLNSGLVVSTSSDQRVCLWRLGTSSVSHIGALCSHVADAAGLAVWEGHMMDEEAEDEGEGKKGRRFEAEERMGISGDGWSPGGLKMMCGSGDGEAAGTCSKNTETADEGEGGEPVEASSKAAKSSSPSLHHRKHHQTHSSSSSFHPHPGPPSTILLEDNTMTPWEGLVLPESSFTSIPPPPPPHPPPPPPPTPPAPQPTPSTPYRGNQTRENDMFSSSFNSEVPSPPAADRAGRGDRGTRPRRRVLPQHCVPRPPRLPPLRPVTNLSFTRSFTFSFFELPLHQSPRCRAERIRNLMLLLRQIHY